MQGSNRTADEDDQHRCDPVPAPLGDVRSVSLLPEFELSCAGATVPVANSSRRLLAFRARHDKPVRRLFASGSLWPHATEQRASACLRTAIWRAPAPRDKPPVTVSATHVGLDPGVRVDYREIVAQAAALLDGHPSPGSGQAQAGPDVPGHPGPSNPGPSNPGPSNPGLSDRPSPLDNPGPWALLMSAPGELLPGWYDEWVTVERERYRQLRLHALEEVCDRLLRHGQYPQALMVVLAAVSGEPLRESAHRLVVRAHVGEGNISEAVRHYHHYTAMLRAELGVTPTHEMVALVAEWLSRRAAAPPGAGGAW